MSNYKRTPPLAFLDNLIFGVSPDVAYTWRDSNGVGPKHHLFLLGAIPTFVFCFLTTAVLCGLEGVLFSTGKVSYQGIQYGHVAFFADKMNMFFYAVLNPAVIGCSVILWVAALKSCGVTASGGPAASGRTTSREGRRFLKPFLAVTLVVTLSTLAISNYINDVASYKSAVASQTFYWFHGSLEIGHLHPITVHYMILNFVLLAAVLTNTGFFMAAAWHIMRLGTAVQRPAGERMSAIDDLKRRASPLMDVYVTGRLIIGLNMIHALVWSRNEQLSNTANKAFEFFFVAIFGVFFVAVPRYYVEGEWRKVAISSKLIQDSDMANHDIGSGRWTRLSAHAIDTFAIGGFILSWYLW